MIEPKPIQQQIAEALHKFRMEHYPHRPKAIYLGAVEYHKLRDKHGPVTDEMPRKFDGVTVFEVWATNHLNIG